MTRVALEPPPFPQPDPDLEPISWLLRNYADRRQFLDRLDTERAEIVERIFQCATKLEQGTGWDGDTLVHWLGCPTSSVGEFRDLHPERLTISRDYLCTLDGYVSLIEAQFDKRMLVLGYGHLYLAAEKDIGAIKAAFAHGTDLEAASAEECDLSAIGFLELGEVQPALDTASLVIDPKQGEEIRTPFDGRPPVHLSTSRLDALIKGDGEFDSPVPSAVAERMHIHIGRCRGCEDAYEYRVEQLQNGAFTAQFDD